MKVVGKGWQGVRLLCRKNAFDDEIAKSGKLQMG
jgi:hypothetical protein